MQPPTEDVLGEGTTGGLPLSQVLSAQYAGVQGETIFTEPYVNLLDHQGQTRSREIFQRLGAFKDDRSMALISALVCEAYVDRILSTFMPGYVSNIKEDSNFSFSMKIKVLRALDIVPRHLTRGADLVREVRNKFAHNLELDSLEDVEKKILDRLRSFADLRKVRYVDLSDCRSTYDFAVSCATSGLAGYLVNVRDFNAAIRQIEFEESLNRINSERRQTHIDAIVQHMTGPVEDDNHDEPF